MSELQSFEHWLPQLLLGDIYAIEYGDPKNAGGHFSLLRVRRINTPAGEQYCIKFITSGMEGSGEYVPTLQLLVERLVIYLDRYHRPSRFVNQHPPKLCFFPIKDQEDV